MNIQLVIARRNFDKCLGCGVCKEIVACAGGNVGNASECVGCGACYLACPNSAIELIEAPRKREVGIYINGERVYVPERITVLKALEFLGYRIGSFPGEGEIFAPCRVGGCYSCAVEIDGQIKPSCITKVREGMKIVTSPRKDHVPLRAVYGWMGHPVGVLEHRGGLRVNTMLRQLSLPAGATFVALNAKTGQQHTTARRRLSHLRRQPF